MNKAMPTAPSAPMMDDQQLVGHHGPPPPSYDQAMGHQPAYMPQPGMAPYPQQNCECHFEFQ
ncbi:hypothetical protein C0J52_17703 [Blattella germanica]|nr:hypothetical protein C0J52_17703 [Blattella germanica]